MVVKYKCKQCGDITWHWTNVCRVCKEGTMNMRSDLRDGILR